MQGRSRSVLVRVHLIRPPIFPINARLKGLSPPTSVCKQKTTVVADICRRDANTASGTLSIYPYF